MAHFRVDPTLPSLLGQGYRSSELALKELIDNAWDADAENVFVTLPALLTRDAIVIQDDGTGMTEQEVSEHYLTIANSRFSRKGTHTPKGRAIKGRKGIGKFAGLLAADRMTLVAKARGKATTLEICESDLRKPQKDLEDLVLPLKTESCSDTDHGTTIILTDLHQSLTVPTPERMKQALMLEYGRERDFKIWVNGVAIGIEDIPGKTYTRVIDIPGKGQATLKYTIADRDTRLKHSGIAIRVGGKIVGKPFYFDLDSDEELPEKLCKKIFGEIEADGLADSVTADWGAFIENSSEFQAIAQEARAEVKEKLGQEYTQLVSLARARLQSKINRQLASLPEHKKHFAELALEKIFNKFYGEDEEKFATIISVVITAFERDEYWEVLRKIDETRHGAVEALAEALNAFGVLETATIAKQAMHRLKVLDDIEALVFNESTLEATIHHALENNLWIFNGPYSLVSSNKTLKKVIEEYTSRNFTGDRAMKRPDLFLASTYREGHLLIEFKKPSITITRAHETQAIEYRDDLAKTFTGKISILVLGKDLDSNIATQYNRDGNDVRLMSYKNLIADAKTQLDWLIKELS